MSGGSTAALIASFSASLVEFVEALTIVLAVGTTRGWTSALTGAGAAVLMLVVVIAVAGPALTTIPIGLFQMVVGVLLLLFGMRWLQKAILRSAGIIALHDEGTAFEGSKGELAGSSNHRHETMDWLGFTTALKAVLLEGVEVAFIVLAIGSGPALLGPAISGAALALVAVIALGVMLRRPLAQIPENSLKFVVGLILTAFGIFWTGEGLGVEWYGGDAALFYLAAVLLAASIVFRDHARRVAP